MVEESSDYVLRRGLGVRGSHYLNDGKKDFGFHHSALDSKNLPQSAPLSENRTQKNIIKNRDHRTRTSHHLFILYIKQL
jgi:hypothetical protein